MKNRDNKINSANNINVTEEVRKQVRTVCIGYAYILTNQSYAFRNTSIYTVSWYSLRRDNYLCWLSGPSSWLLPYSKGIVVPPAAFHWFCFLVFYILLVSINAVGYHFVATSMWTEVKNYEENKFHLWKELYIQFRPNWPYRPVF